jgi:hypothetical protein
MKLAPVAVGLSLNDVVLINAVRAELTLQIRYGHILT